MKREKERLTNLHLHFQPARPQQSLVYHVLAVGHSWSVVVVVEGGRCCGDAGCQRLYKAQFIRIFMNFCITKELEQRLVYRDYR